MGELEQFKARQAELWGQGDYRPVGELLAPGAEALVEAAGVAPGQRVLDIGVGTGNVALAAARRGADVVGVDITEAWFGAARRRAAEHGVHVDLRLGDAEALDEPDSCYDVVLSSFAMMFAPRHERVAEEVARVCRAGGTIGYTSWDPDQSTNTLLRFLPSRPGFASDPNLWADPSHVEALFADVPVTWTFDRRSLPVAFTSIPAFEEWAFTNSSGMMTARQTLQDAGTWDRAHAALQRALHAENRATDGSYQAHWHYLMGLGRLPNTWHS